MKKLILLTIFFTLSLNILGQEQIVLSGDRSNWSDIRTVINTNFNTLFTNSGNSISVGSAGQIAYTNETGSDLEYSPDLVWEGSRLIVSSGSAIGINTYPGASTLGPSCVVIGSNAGTNTTGYSNTLIGSSAGQYLVTGVQNTFLGYSAGLNCTGNRNVFLGMRAGYDETGDDKLYIENSTTTTPLIYGDFALDSLQINGSLNITGNIYQNGGEIGGGSSLWGEDGSDIYFNTGWVGVGVNNPQSALHIQGGDILGRSPGGEDRFFVDGLGTDVESASLLLYSNDGTSTVRLFAENNAPRIQTIYDVPSPTSANVNIGSDGQLTRASSSIKLKKDVVYNINPELTLRLKPASYKSKVTNEAMFGFIAEQVDSIDSRFATNQGMEYMGLDLNALISAAISTIQVQEVKIDSLKNRLQKLELKLE